MSRIEVYSDGVNVLNLGSPSFSAIYNTKNLTDGRHNLTAVAVDQVGNRSAASDPISVVVDNVALTVTITSPAANTPFRSQATVAATTSKSVQQVVFAL